MLSECAQVEWTSGRILLGLWCWLWLRVVHGRGERDLRAWSTTVFAPGAFEQPVHRAGKQSL